MKATIVYSGKGKGNILDRQAAHLARVGGWDYEAGPSPKCDLNHFICYVEFAERYSDWHATLISAWFTHYEAGVPFKEFWWNLAANNADLRITAAPQYAPLLQPFGLTTLCGRPAVDRWHFDIVERDWKRDKPLIGLAGFVHPGGRKGEKMVARLAGSKLGGRVELKATGEGWPCPTQMIDWADLPKFYNSLDLFLCTSLTEGVPHPPLEALACGIPIVIPRGVGMLDLLPDAPGVYRYPAGDFDAMCKTIERALDSRKGVDRASLRELTADYTPENWTVDHVAAFGELLRTEHAQRESDRHGKRGALYVAFGEPARECARAAIASFKKCMPGIPVALVADKPGLGEDIYIQFADEDIGGRSAKTRIFDIAPRDWQYILYLDADTEICADVSFLFDALTDGWDMVICKNPVKYHIAWEMRRSDNGDECDYTFSKIGTGELVQLNGGVFGFQRNDRTMAFFHAWHEEWKRYGKRDQGALLRSLYANPVKMYVLENYPWNCITRYDQRDDVCVKHYPMAARRWRGKVRERSDSAEAWAAVREFERSAGK